MPSLRELSGNTRPQKLLSQTDTMNPYIKQDTHQVSTSPKNPLTNDHKNNKEMNIVEADGPDSAPQSDSPLFDLAFAVTQAQQPERTDLSAKKMSDQIIDQMADGTILKTPPLTLPELNISRNHQEHL